MHLVVSAGRALALLCLCACASSAPEVEVAAPRRAAPKDPDALVLEVVVDEGSSEAERSRALLLERVERSSKLSSSPADGTRRLKVRLSIAEPTVDSRGLSRKVRLEGSLHGGSCTILTLSPEATKPGGKADRAADRDEVLVAGIDALIQKLEAAAPKISDDATCFSTGK